MRNCIKTLVRSEYVNKHYYFHRPTRGYESNATTHVTTLVQNNNNPIPKSPFPKHALKTSEAIIIVIALRSYCRLDKIAELTRVAFSNDTINQRWVNST